MLFSESVVFIYLTLLQWVFHRWAGLLCLSLLLACPVLHLVSDLKASHLVHPSNLHRVSEAPLLGNIFATFFSFYGDEYLFAAFNLPPSKSRCMGIKFAVEKGGTQRRAGQVVFLVNDVGRRMKCISSLTSQKVCCTYLANRLTAPHRLPFSLVRGFVHGMLRLVITSTRVVLGRARCSSPACQVGFGQRVDETNSRIGTQAHNRRNLVIGPCPSM